MNFMPDTQKVTEDSDATYNSSSSLMDFENINSNRSQKDELLKLLRHWKLEKLADLFIAEKVYINVLKVIKRHHIPKLLKDLDYGTHILFEHHLEQWRYSIGRPMSYDVPYNIPNIPPSAPLAPALPSNSIRSSSASSLLSFEPYDDGAHQTPKHEISLSDVLNKTAKGRTLVKKYGKVADFNDTDRVLLIRSIIQYFEEKNVGMSLKTSYRLEKEIIERFPTEKIEYYRTAKRGRIYNKASNSKCISKPRTSRKSNVEKPNKTKVFAPENDANTYIQSMKFDKLSSEEFDSCWKSCIQFRLNEIHNNLKATNEVFLKWPFYTKPTGFRLIDMDFKFLFPTGDGLLNNFENSCEQFVQFFFAESHIKDAHVKKLLDTLKNETNLSENGRQALIFWGMHGYLVPTDKVVKKDSTGKKSVKKFTIKDSQEAFVFVGKSTQEIEEHINYLKSFKGNVQPFIFGVGEDITKISDIHVWFNDIKYSCLSFLRAVDICLKIFYVFNLDFPKECCMFWTFVAYHFFNLKCEKTYSNVHTLSKLVSTNL